MSLPAADPTVLALIRTREQIMKRNRVSVLALAVALLLGVMAVETEAQTVNQRNQNRLGRRNMGGPRLGVTYVFGEGERYQELKDNDMGRLISQFGWHFEHQVVPEGGGPEFVIQVVPMIGGVEYGKILPITALAMGVRFPGGLEFGMGPELMVNDDGLESALILGIGKTFDYGGVSIPVNLVLTRNLGGTRLSLIFGYSIQKRP
ncbi:hypothetical protein ACFL6R_01635 [Gemmatimonadota bacterium]